MPTPPIRYEIARSSIVLDRLMNHFIKVGGIAVVTAVFGIFVFIAIQIVPLFRGADVKEAGVLQLPAGEWTALGADEWTERPFLVGADGRLLFFDPTGLRPHEILSPALAEGEHVTAVQYVSRRQELVLGTSSGAYHIVKILFEPIFDQGVRTISARIETSPRFQLGRPGLPASKVCLGASEAEKLVALLQMDQGQPVLHVDLLSQRRSLSGKGTLKRDATLDLSEQLAGGVVKMIASARADALLVRSEDNRIQYFFREGGVIAERQVLEPLAGRPGIGLASMNYVFGDDSVVFTATDGSAFLYSLFPQGQDMTRLFAPTRTLDPFEQGAHIFSPSIRNKAFAFGGLHSLSIRYATTQSTRWQKDVPYRPAQMAFSGKYDRLLVLDDQHKVHLYTVHDPHPEASFKAFFGKLWYEGSPEQKFEWQSSGASDDFEPKLSMIPLLIGTLKGTLYAMLFSVPLALLAALYTSQFAHPDFKKFIKPVMEIMASLPSVILGFLSALWLAPLVETRVPSFLLMMILVPTVVIGFGNLWTRLPYHIRSRLRPGYEFLAVLPVVLASAALAWNLGPVIEGIFFIGRDLTTGQPIPDFRLWWTQVVGLPFEQRNSLVVGFMMGFAVIPIIFTITEDALSNVPKAFQSASLALGASRWQTAIRVILPTASAGIFSAVMIGFGRAVGETMIVLMATGNTPIMDFNIFSGMRTLSANIAVELPEAPHHSTLYRALFLGALLLFLMTFLVNTAAEMLRHHLREKYKAV